MLNAGCSMLDVRLFLGASGMNCYKPDPDNLRLSSLILWVFAVKVIIFLLDPTVMFFMKDSLRYLDTALSSHIPQDRSFFYGFLIRWLTCWSSSLTPLVLFQVLCSASSAVISGYLLNRFLSVRRPIALGFAVLCAIAPIGLLYERYVMTESVSLFCFALFMAAAFHHLRYRRVGSFVLMNLVGVVVIAFRLSYLPSVLCAAVLVPLLPLCRDLIARLRKTPEDQHTSIGKTILKSGFYIFLSCFLAFGFHTTYKSINGRFSNKPPAYQYCDGFHILSAWAPLLEAEDFSDPLNGIYILQHVSFDLKDRFQRMNQRWAKNGLTNYICRLYDIRVEENKAAKEAAMNILRRDPEGVLKLALQSYLDYWNLGLLKETLRGDRYTRTYTAEIMEVLKSEYQIDAEGRNVKKTLTNQYFLNAIPWYWVLFSLPLVIGVSFAVDRGRHALFLVLPGVCSLLIFLNATALVHRNTLRFFHPNEWLAFLFLGVIIDRLLGRDA